MKKVKINRFFLRFFFRTGMIISVFLILAVLFWRFKEKTHATLCKNAIALILSSNPSPMYQEINYFEPVIDTGAFHEDDKLNSFNHFYKSSSLPGKVYFEYDKAYAYYKGMGSGFIPPPGGVYENALEWSRKKQADGYTWEKAIENYSYTTNSKLFSYTALGHVVHCLQDMGIRDHALRISHPGSSMNDMRYQDPNKEGYELFVENNKSFLPTGTSIMKLPSLDQYFDNLATYSRTTANNSTPPLPLAGESAMGLRDIPTKFIGNFSINPFSYDVLIPWAGTITPGSRGPYFTYACTLNKAVIEYSAGLMQLFYDIVNPPPFLQKVRIWQYIPPFGDKLMYDAEWIDGNYQTVTLPNGNTVTLLNTRTLQLNVKETLCFDKYTWMELEFGPYVTQPPKQIDPSSIVANFGGVPLQMLTFTQGAGANLAIWKSQIFAMPQVSPAFLNVVAKDPEPHFASRTPLGDLLDSDPASPAWVSGSPPYNWKLYEPGADVNHQLLAQPCN